MDYYEILGVSRSASPTEIRNAYRKLAKLYHPDRNNTEGAKSAMVLINEAYEILSDPNKKRGYDQPVFTFETPVAKEDPKAAYRREFIRKKRQEKREEQEALIQFKRKIGDFFAKLNYVTAFVGAILTFDYYLPTLSYTEKYIEGIGLKSRDISNTPNGYQYSNTNTIIVEYGTYIIKTTKFIMAVPDLVYLIKSPASADKTLLVEASPVLRIPKYVSMGSQQGIYRPFRVERTIYSIGDHFPLFILIPALAVIFFRYQGCFVGVFMTVEFFSVVILLTSIGEGISDKAMF
jgi:hypothetical protein